MNTPSSPTPARPSLDELFETCAANLKLDDVTQPPFVPPRIPPAAAAGAKGKPDRAPAASPGRTMLARIRGPLGL